MSSTTTTTTITTTTITLPRPGDTLPNGSTVLHIECVANQRVYVLAFNKHFTFTPFVVWRLAVPSLEAYSGQYFESLPEAFEALKARL